LIFEYSDDGVFVLAHRVWDEAGGGGKDVVDLILLQRCSTNRFKELR